MTHESSYIGRTRSSCNFKATVALFVVSAYIPVPSELDVGVCMQESLRDQYIVQQETLTNPYCSSIDEINFGELLVIFIEKALMHIIILIG